MSEGLRGPVVCIVGPTASGKSSLSELVALELGSDVISVDSMQVYRGMDIGTAKTPLQERRVPLQMVDVVGIDEDYSVARFQKDCRKLIDERLATGDTPVLCGGTGLYLDAVVDEMEFPTGETHGVTRGRYEQMLEDKGAQAIWDLLYERDPLGAEAIHPNNSKRVVRALEMLDQGVKYSAQLENLRVRKPRYDARIWALTMDRDRLYARINQRVNMMVEQGLVSEVEGLVSRGYGVDLTACQAIGYNEILEYLDGEISLDEAVELIKRRTRHYAKRQLSWLRRDGRANWIDLDAVSPDEAVDLIISDVRSRYRS